MKDMSDYKDEIRVRRDQYLKRTYSLSLADWESMFVSQGSVCKICKKRKKRYDTDHDHATGKVRGIICHRCNVMLGHARDNQAILLAGYQYLVDSVKEAPNVEPTAQPNG